MKTRIPRTTRRRYDAAIKLIKEGKTLKQASVAAGISTALLTNIAWVHSKEDMEAIANARR
jgi:hypothetical protein